MTVADVHVSHGDDNCTLADVCFSFADVGCRLRIILLRLMTYVSVSMTLTPPC